MAMGEKMCSIKYFLIIQSKNMPCLKNYWSKKSFPIFVDSKWMRMGGWLNRSLRARWSLLSGSDRLYLLWGGQASLYRRPIHQHPFFSTQHTFTHLSCATTFFSFQTMGLCVLCFCFVVFSLVLCCHSRGRPPILCLTPTWTFFFSWRFTRCKEKRKRN